MGKGTILINLKYLSIFFYYVFKKCVKSIKTAF